MARVSNKVARADLAGIIQHLLYVQKFHTDEIQMNNNNFPLAWL